MPAGRLWDAAVQRGGGISKGRREGKYTVRTQVSPDLEGASQALFTARHLRHSAFSRNAGPLPLTTSAYCMFACLFLLPPPHPPPPSMKGINPGWLNSIYWCLPSFHFLVIEWKTQIMCLIDQREQISFVGINNSLQLTEPKELHLFELFDWSCPGKTALPGAMHRGPYRQARALLFYYCQQSVFKTNICARRLAQGKRRRTNLIYSPCFFSVSLWCELECEK